MFYKTKSYKKWKEEYKREDYEGDLSNLSREQLEQFADEMWCQYLYLQYLIAEEDWERLKEISKELQFEKECLDFIENENMGS